MILEQDCMKVKDLMSYSARIVSQAFGGCFTLATSQVLVSRLAPSGYVGWSHHVGRESTLASRCRSADSLLARIFLP